jgi:putative nucleotidyltransferase with HDIG domain
MKKQILFVDDDRNVLEGLQRMLRVLRNEWEMYFALSGPEALAIMAARPIDVIVADMRMPGMNGVELLTEVMRRHPGTIRIILSGHADQDLIMKSVRVTHQYLSKPCDAETLKITVMRAVQLRALLAEESLKNLVSQTDSLPSLPTLYFELARELESPEVSIKRVSQIIAQDPAMTAKILQLANSAFFGLRRQVSDSSQAVFYLGVDRIQHLFLFIHLFSHFDPSACGGFSIDDLWKHSVATAVVAKRIAHSERADKKTMEAAFTAGLLHDIGKLMLASQHPHRYRKVMVYAKEHEVPFWEAERELMGASHAEVGAYLLGLWALPDPIVEAVAFHHQPSRLFGKDFCALAALHAANALVRNGSDPKEEGIDIEYLAALGLQDRLPAWRCCATELFQDGARQ